MNNHYDWLDIYFQAFVENCGLNDDLRGLISAHGDKCYSYRCIWEEYNIPFEHGVAIYLLTYVKPFSEQVRNTKTGWVDPYKWVIDNYKKLKIFFNKDDINN